MSRRRRIILIVSVLVAVMVGLWGWTRREPSYQGRTLGEWCDLGLEASGALNQIAYGQPSDKDPVVLREESTRAREAIVRMGDRAVAFMLVREQESWNGREAGVMERTSKQVGAWFSPALRWSGKLETQRHKRREADFFRVGFIVFSLGDKAAGAVPEMMRRLVARHPSGDLMEGWGQIHIVQPGPLVSRIGPSALPEVLPYLSHPSPNVRTMSRHIVFRWG